MQEMIEELLKYSRVDTQGDRFEPIDLDEVLTDALTDLQLKNEESDAEIAAESLPASTATRTSSARSSRIW